MKYPFAASLLVCATLFAQDVLRFEVTSVRQLEAPRGVAGNFGCGSDGRFVSTARGIRPALQWAYDVKPYQVVNLPNWIDARDAYYDIEAVAGRNVTQAECRQMVQSLLADRFGLVVSRPMQEIDVMVLVVARGGYKLEPASESDDEPGVRIVVNGVPMASAAGAPRDAKAPNGWTMAQLVEALSTVASVGFSKPLVDRTGLGGFYKFGMEFSLRFPGTRSDGSPDLIDAIERLGLRLEERKEPFEMLHIERIDRPTDN